MRLSVDPRRTIAEAGEAVCIAGAAKTEKVLPTHFLLIALGATLLVGCDTAPLPESALVQPALLQPALLQPQPPPRCNPKGEAGQRKQQPAPAGGSAKATDTADAAALRKLDYEAQCYRHAEMIARNRLGRLQNSVQGMVKSGKVAPTAAPPPPPSTEGLPY
jgi:hypothetical protein